MTRFADQHAEPGRHIPGIGGIMTVCGVRAYTVSQKDGMWYAHMVGYPSIPVFGSFSDKRSEAVKWAAASMGLTYKEYMHIRSKYGEK